MRERLLLCTDLDRTVLPNGEPPESPGARPRIRRVAADPRVTLVYVTGRDADSVDAARAEFGLPAPAFLIADVGTTIAARDGDTWSRWSRWDDAIGVDWPAGTAARVRICLAGVTGLSMQEESQQGRYKVSWYAQPGSEAEERALREEVDRQLASERVPARTVWSVDDVARVGLLDVLPPRADKRQAIEFLRAELGFALEETMFAGDSGNDLEVLVSPIPSVVPANAADALKAEARRGAESSGNGNALYVAVGGFEHMNGNYAAGILEGIEHFRPGFLAAGEERA